MIRRSTLGLFAAFVTIGATLAFACDDGTAIVDCRNIPAGGCPRTTDAVCDDPTCAAVYVCKADGTWSLDHTCPPHPDAAADTASPPPRDAAAPRDVEIDVPGASGGPGCEDLEPPDCPLGTAAACPSGCCGCEDLFVCVNHGWNSWGTCDDDAGIVARP